jgi:4-amino-4-deoxy-L-arabinose transferase-like glycosyltransferase
MTMKATRTNFEQARSCLNTSVINYAWLAICCLASGTLAAVISAHRPLWLDELYMLITVRRPFVDGLFQLEDYSAPLYQLILRLFVHTDTPETFVFRLPALLSAVLGLVSTWWLAKNLFNTRVAAISIFIVGFNPCFLNYATESRPYTLFLLFSVLSFGTFYKCLVSHNCYFLTAYICSSLLLVYSHYFGLLVFPAQILLLLAYFAHSRQTLILKRMGFALGTVLFLCIPAVYLISRHTSEGLTALKGMAKTNLAALLFARSGATFFADTSLCILCIWPLLIMSWGVVVRFKSNKFFEADARDLSIHPSATWYLTPLLTIAWMGFSWYLLLIISCVKPGYTDRYAFPVLIPCVLMLSAITASAACRVLVLILMIVSLSYAFHIRDQIDYANRDFPELAIHLQSVNQSDTKVWITDWPVLNDIEPVKYALRYYGYTETNISRLALDLLTGGGDLEIQAPGLLQKDDHFFVVARKPEYEHSVDKYLEHAHLQCLKVSFGSLTLFDVHKPPAQR